MEQNNGILINKEYKDWISDVSMRYKSSQIKAAMKVNDEMLRFFWSLGKDMHIRKETYSWGEHFYKQVSSDLKKALPDVKSFSPRNLLYMHQFYRLFPEASITHQVDAKSEITGITHQTDAKNEHEEVVFYIPWGHIKAIMDKCCNDHDRALFFVKKTFANNWSRAVLQNFLSTDLYERQGKAVTNFTATLPQIQGDLAQEITKDPYNFDFLSIREKYDEKELKDALMESIKDFLLELGNGFAFVGREYRLMLGAKENYVDMLFFNIRLRCYVVLDVKVTEFDSSFAGKLGTYVVTVNHQLKEDWMNPTIGLLICKGLDKVEAQYALEASSQPIGVSGYELSKMIPEEYIGSMPTIEEIEAELENFNLGESISADELMNNLDKLHTTELGEKRIRKNLNIDADDIVSWCRSEIKNRKPLITKNGKNWYVHIDNYRLTINPSSFTIITAHKL